MGKKKKKKVDKNKGKNENTVIQDKSYGELFSSK